jgi:SWI/SNF-related matrix-associated actin-dependent regulator 1 of chromatin subfamily A
MTLDLFTYQEEGAAFLAAHMRACLLDDPGVGKSAQAIRAMDLARIKRALIICPSSVKEVWKGEIRKFARLPRKVLKAKSIDDLGLFMRGRVDVLLVSYEMATKWAKRLIADQEIIECIIFDEAHYMMNDGSQRTIALLGPQCDGKAGLIGWAARVWFLTGTPMPNDPLDIWPMLRATGATVLDKSKFKKRYFSSRLGSFSSRQTPLDAMVPELRQVIRAVSMRRTKEQAGLQLPPIFLTTQTVEGDTDEIRALLREHPGMEKAVIDAVEKGGLSFLDAQHIATLRRLVGEAKAPAFAEMLIEELENGLSKVVIFGLHRRPIEIISESLSRAGKTYVVVDGRTRDIDRVRNVEQFQRDKDCCAFLGNIRAAGTGLTLTAASELILFESDWSPGANAQAIMRVHRLSQTRTVRARFIVLSNSIDEIVTETVARKTAAIGKIGFEMAAMA